MKSFFSPEPVIFANQGGNNSFPKNSIPCFEKSFELGAHAICIHVQLSKDGVLMVIPDNRSENPNFTGKVSDYTALELRELDPGLDYSDENGDFPFKGKGLHYPALEELLLYFPDKKFNIALIHKDKKTAHVYSEVIKKCNAESRIFTVAVYGAVIKEVRKNLPDSPTAFTLPGLLGIYALFRSGFLFAFSSFEADVLQTSEKIGGSYIANRGLVRQLQEKGIRVYVWDVKTEIDLQRLYDAGVNGYVTDNVEMVKNFLDSK